MKSPRPTLRTTHVDPATNEWLPATFGDFVVELDSLKQSLATSNALALFRGQRRREWRLDSTFARSVKSLLFGMEPEEGYSTRLIRSSDLNAALSSITTH